MVPALPNPQRLGVPQFPQFLDPGITPPHPKLVPLHMPSVQFSVGDPGLRIPHPRDPPGQMPSNVEFWEVLKQHSRGGGN